MPASTLTKDELARIANFREDVADALDAALVDGGEVFDAATDGLVPATAGAPDSYVLRADGTWGAQAGGAGAFLPEEIIFTSDLASGDTVDWLPTGTGGTWPDITRVYCGGDQTTETRVTGIDSTGITVGKVMVFELGDGNSHGPITLVDFLDPDATGSLAKNRIVCPGSGNASASVVVPAGGAFAVEKIEDDSSQHGWRVLWVAANAAKHWQVQHLQVAGPLAVTLGSGDTDNLATTGILRATRVQVTTHADGSTLTGISHNATTAGLVGVVDGEVKIIENLGPAELTLAHLRGSTSDNEFYHGDAIDVVLGVGGTAVYLRDMELECWRLVGCAGRLNAGTGPTLSTSTLPAGDTDNWNPAGLHTRKVVRVTANVAGSTLTGIDAGQDGEELWLEVTYTGSVGSLTLAHYRTSSAANRFVCPGLTDFVIQKGGGVGLVYRSYDQAWLVRTGGF